MRRVSRRSAASSRAWTWSTPSTQKTAPTRDQADAFLAEQIERRLAATDANDMLYAFDSSREYDPSPGLEKIAAPVLAINSADDERGALRCPEALVEVDLRDVLSHQCADRDPGEGMHHAREDEERREAPEPLQHPTREIRLSSVLRSSPSHSRIRPTTSGMPEVERASGVGSPIPKYLTMPESYIMK